MFTGDSQLYHSEKLSYNSQNTYQDQSSIRDHENQTVHRGETNGVPRLLDVSMSVDEQELLAMSRDSMKSTRQVNHEIENLIKTRHYDTEDSGVAITEMIPGYSNHNIYKVGNNHPKIDFKTLFENWIIDNQYLDKNFILVWLNEVESPNNFYQKAKNNLCSIQKRSSGIVTEENLIHELK